MSDSPMGFHLVEFYVTCNPPLTPAGVNFVFESVAEAFPEEKSELLYEPEIPWFKLVTFRAFKDTISGYIKNLLLSIVEEDADLVDLDHHYRHHVPVDVKTVKEHPRVIPWSSYVAGPNDLGQSEAWCFPATMRCLPHKKLWRGLESTDGWTVDQFFKRLASQWGQLRAPASIEHLSASLRCQVSYNVAANLLYLGTALHPSVVEKAVETLDNLLDVASRDRRSEHLIVTEGTGTFRFSYRWLSHVGLYRTTYIVRRQDGSAGDDHLRLSKAVTIRAERQDKDGRWIENKSGYPSKAGMKPGTMKVFGPFNGYSYEKKQPSSVLVHFQAIAQAQEALKRGPEVGVYANLEAFDAAAAKPAAPPLSEKVPGFPHSSQALLLDIDDHQPRESSGNKVVTVSAGIKAGPSSLKEQRSSKDFVELWRDAVERAQPEEVEEPWQPPRAGSPSAQTLIDLDEPHTEGSPGQDSELLAVAFRGLQVNQGVTAGQEPRETLLQFHKSDDLICLDPMAQEASGSCSQGLGTRQKVPCQSLLDADVPPLQGTVLETMRTRGQYVGQNKSTLAALEGITAASGGRLQVAHPQSQKPETGSAWGTKPPSRTVDAGKPPGQDSGKRAAASHGMDPPAATPSQRQDASSAERLSRKSHILKLAEERVQDLAGILPLIPGIVTIDLKFGRFYRKNLSSSQVHVGFGPHCNMAEMTASLGMRDWQQNLGFSTALSACGPDIEDFVQMHPHDGPPWRLWQTQVSYLVACTVAGQGKMIVEIDAKTFQYLCRGVDEELGCVYLHCAHRPWDMQVCISRKASLAKSRLHLAVADALVASFSARTAKDGNLSVETTVDERLGATVDGINVRNVARYRLGGNSDSVLSVAMTKRLARGEKQERRMKWETGQGIGLYKGGPGVWYEAFVSSLKARALLSKNVDMELGERACWDSAELAAGGMLESICRPGFGMISQMDEIGLLNDNGLKMQDQDGFDDPVVERTERKGKKVEYW